MSTEIKVIGNHVGRKSVEVNSESKHTQKSWPGLTDETKELQRRGKPFDEWPPRARFNNRGGT